MIKYKLCFEVKSLSDAAAFESLAVEMGIPMELTSVQQEAEPAPSLTGRGKGSRHYPVTPDVVAKVKSTINAYKNASNKRIRELADLPHGLATIGRIRKGEYDRGTARYASMIQRYGAS